MSGLVGQPLRRREDDRLLRGAGRYLDDIELPGLAHAAFVRSPHAHARLGAVRFPSGSLLTLAAADLEGIRRVPVRRLDGVELADEAHPVLAAGEVRYVGQPVALVVADTRALAEDLAERVEVEYEPLEPELNPRTASGWLMRFEQSAGDVEAGFAAADRVVRCSYRVPRLVAAPIEPRGAIASYDPEDDLLTVWLSAQDPHRPLDGLAHVLGRPDDRIRVVVPDVGGAFGSKGVVVPEWAATAIAAQRLGRPVKWTEDRLENFVASYQGRGLEADVELACSAAGDFLALRARLVADLGGYLLPTTPVAAHTTALLLTGCYRIPAAAVELVGARTNRVPTGPYRGAGRPEAALLLEATVDAAARELGIDRVDLRRRNLIAAVDFPYETPLGWTYDSGDYERCLDTALDLLGDVPREADVGVGLALYVERGGGAWEAAEARAELDGRVVIAAGSTPHGQGHETTFLQIAADELEIPPERIELRFGDTAVVPRGVGTFASRSTAMGGSAVALACRDLRAQLDGPGGDLRPLVATCRFESPLVFASGCYAAVVRLDRATGQVRVERVVAVDDAGTIVNPLLAEGQVLGGVVQAVGECLTEEALDDERGQPLRTSFLEYLLPTAAEAPAVDSAFVETPSPFNPLGAKGIGEGGTIGALAAIANAVADVLGEWIDPPFVEEKVWHVLHARERAGAA